jgi:hypothetical protein
MTRTVQLPKPLTPDDRLGHIPYAFRHTSATLGWHGIRVEYNSQQPASDIVHPPLECLWLMLTGEAFPERTDHRCDDARHNGNALGSEGQTTFGQANAWLWSQPFAEKSVARSRASDIRTPRFPDFT